MFLQILVIQAFVEYSLLYTYKWNFWVIWLTLCLTFRRNAKLFLKWLHRFILTSAVFEDSNSPCWRFYYSHPNACEVVVVVPLIYISLMANDVKHLFSIDHASWPFVYLPWRNFFQMFCSLLIELCFVWLWEFLKYILDTRCYQMCNLQIFSPILCIYFPFFMVSFIAQKFILMKFNWFTLSFLVMPLVA